jgi:hypothetical protein
MFEKESCIRVKDIPFAAEKPVKGKWVIRTNRETGEIELIDVNAFQRDAGDMHFVIGDEMEPVKSNADDKIYTSKSKLRQSYRELGFVEIGNDKLNQRGQKRWKKPPAINSILTAMEKLESSGYREELRQKKERGIL